ncbi:MAG TPA: hypothetical protein VF143_01160, partial [Candidatus Nanopelagicales bacterium]
MSARRLIALLAAAGLALSGCTGSETPSPGGAASGSGAADAVPVGDPQDTSTDVAFTPCGAGGLACTGMLEGLPYEVRLPETWNGSLLLYSHGLRRVDPARDSEQPFTPRAEVALGEAVGFDLISRTLLKEGYALAGVGAPEGGWQVDGALAGLGELRTAFVEQVGVPNRILTWGDSLGAWVAVQAGQTEPWVNGSLGMCGLLGGLNPNMDLALDVGVAVKALLAPELQLTGFSSAADARKEYERAMAAITEAAADPSGAGLTALQVIAAVTATPTQSRMSAGIGAEALGAALIENLGEGLARTTLERFRVEESLGGNPSTNVGVNYGERVTTEQAAAIDAGSTEGATLALVRQIASLPPVEADPQARTAADEEFPRPQALAKPTLTLHTSVDPVAILPNETLFSRWAAAASGQDIRWLNVNVAYPPATYPE